MFGTVSPPTRHLLPSSRRHAWSECHGHLVAVIDDRIVWRWLDAVVVCASDGLVRLWEPAHREVLAQPRYDEVEYAPGQGAYLSAGLPGAACWVESQESGNDADAVVDVRAVLAILTEHGLVPRKPAFR